MPLPQLTAPLLNSAHSFPANVAHAPSRDLPERVLQFGEGNFLRGFVDWMIHRLNAHGLFNGKIVVVQPIAQGLADQLNAQNGLYTLLLRGVQSGKVVDHREIIASISRAINPYSDFASFLACADNPDLRFIVSNTTEAGIAFSAADQPTDAPPASFPGKLTALLLRRFKSFHGNPARGFVLLPCELIEANGTALKNAVLQTAAHWNLSPEFIAWVHAANQFTSTLVDRIVTGYPRDEAAALTAELGYEDALLDAAEVFHLWVIQGNPALAEELPFQKAGLDVVFTPDMKPYRDRKVRILNGAHTMTVLAAYLAGKDTVKECMDDPLILRYMQAGIHEEIIPTLDLPPAELATFAAAVVERFGNPFIRHFLLSIALNSTSKFKSRILPSIREYLRRTGTLPPRLTFSLAALIAFYRGDTIKDNALQGKRGELEYKIQDDALVLQVFADAWSHFPATADPAAAMKLVSQILGRAEIWGEDLNQLPNFATAVATHLSAILSNGMRDALRAVA